jgi:hypothetical protein
MNIDQPGSQNFYLALAAKDHAMANTDILANVRHKHLTSAVTWEGLASLAGRIATAREARAIPVRACERSRARPLAIQVEAHSCFGPAQ